MLWWQGRLRAIGHVGCDGHAVNDTMLAHGQLLVDDPERIGPIQATGMDQTLFNRVGEGPLFAQTQSVDDGPDFKATGIFTTRRS